jgi:inhibitor of cysteine peptidase
MRTVTLTQQDDGASVAAQQGDEIVIELPENSTTGYRWAVLPTHEPLLSLVRTESTPVSRRIGAPSVRAFVFRANTSGAGQIDLKNWREWEGESSVHSRFTAQVRIS